jgi:molybdate transport system substrate-binding protein
MIPRHSWWSAPLLAVLAVPACSGDGSGLSETDGDGRIVVLAASSLTDAFTELGDAFEASGPGRQVTLSFAGSSSLREQVLAGSPADVFASADVENMTALVDAGAVAGVPRTFTTNRLQIGVPAGNPGSVTGLVDFAEEELLIGLCAQEVPCGRLARQALATAGVRPALDTSAPNVRSLLTKLASGELDAGIVYRTDVRGRPEVEGIDIPADLSVTNDYHIAVLADRRRRDVAEAFVAFVLGPDGQRVLAAHGFGSP